MDRIEHHSNPYLQFGERAHSLLYTACNQALASGKALERKVENWTLKVIKQIPLLAKIWSIWCSFITKCSHLFAKWTGLCYLKRDLKPSERFNSHYPHIRPKIGKYHQTNVRIGERAEDGYRWKKKLLRSATKSIELSANFAGGREFRKILSIIEDRMVAQQKLKTHLILNPELLEKQDSTYLKQLKEKFQDRFEYLIYKPHVHLFPSLHTEENHVKALVVDEKYFVLGGTSIHSRLCREEERPSGDPQSKETAVAKMLAKTTRDNDLIGENIHNAAAIRQQFFNLYALCEKRAGAFDIRNRFFQVKGKRGFCAPFHDHKGLFPKARVKILVGGPEHTKTNSITHQYAHRISKAKKNITLANLEFFPENEIRQALSEKRKASHHVPVKIITRGCPKKAPIDAKIISFLSKHHYILADTVYEYEQPSQVYHKKVGVFDDTHTIIGSYNLGEKSAHFDYEIVCVIKNRAATRKMKQILRKDKACSKKIMRSAIEHLPGENNFFYKIGSFFEKFF